MDRGFFVSENNYIKSLKETIDDSDIVTKLNIYGKDELSIRAVNPTGETYIMDLSYYRNTDYMSQSLLDALENYDTLMESKSEAFKNLLTDLNAYTTQLNTKNSERTTLKGDLEALQTEKDGLIATGSSLGNINDQIEDKEADIQNLEKEISNLQSDLEQVTQQIKALQSFILIENNFTPEQIEELDYYIKEKTVRDHTFIEAQALYEEGIKIIKRLSQPSVQLDIDIVDLFDIVECQPDWNKVTLGDIGTIKFEKFNRDVKLRLIEYKHNFENNKLSLTFGNRKNLNDPNMLMDDLKSSVSSSVSLDINQYKYLDYINSGDKTALYQYINGLLDLAAQGAVAGSNQEVKIDGRGITLTNPSEPNRQVRLMADGIYFTDDGWQSSEIALTSENGVVTQALRGILGEFCTIRADKIIVGDAGEKIPDDVISGSDVWNNIESKLQPQIDGKIQTYFQSSNPNTWTVGDRAKHNGDMWHNTSTKELKRYNAARNSWELIRDKKTEEAFSNANRAQDTADGKRRVFTTTPTPPYDVGDLWAGGANGDLKRCKIPKSSGQSYSAGDWDLASKYTDDAVANAALNKANISIQQGKSYNKVTITSADGIKASHLDGSYTMINAKGIRRYVRGTGYEYNYLTDVGQMTTHHEDFNLYEVTYKGYWRSSGGWLQTSKKWKWARNFGTEKIMPTDEEIEAEVSTKRIYLPTDFRYKNPNIILIPHAFHYPEYYKYVDPDSTESGDGSGLYKLQPMFITNNNMEDKVKVVLEVDSMNMNNVWPYFNVKAYGVVKNDGRWVDAADLRDRKIEIEYQNCYVSGISFSYIATV